MRVLVTGATGFIGKHLANQLAKGGYMVHCLFRDESKTAGLDHKNIRLFQGDILDYRSLKRAVSGCDGVLHTAAFTRVWTKDEDEIFRINVDGTVNVLEAALAAHAREVVITSTAGIFGPSIKGIINEEQVSSVDFFTRYEETKKNAVDKASSFITEGLNIRFVCPTRVYGPGVLNDSNSVTRIIKLYLAGKWRIIPGNGRSVGNYVFIDDVVKGHILALEKGKKGAKYILGGENVTYDRFFQSLSDLSGKEYTLFHLPFPLMLSLSYFLTGLSWLTRSRPPIIPALVRKYNHNWNTSSQKAEHDLGYSITPLREGIAETMRWLQGQDSPVN
jgi:nucleoside-diphosphate-sugar epimerase